MHAVGDVRKHFSDGISNLGKAAIDSGHHMMSATANAPKTIGHRAHITGTAASNLVGSMLEATGKGLRKVGEISSRSGHAINDRKSKNESIQNPPTSPNSANGTTPTPNNNKTPSKKSEAQPQYQNSKNAVPPNQNVASQPQPLKQSGAQPQHQSPNNAAPPNKNVTPQPQAINQSAAQPQNPAKQDGVKSQNQNPNNALPTNQNFAPQPLKQAKNQNFNNALGPNQNVPQSIPIQVK